jgi:hypothetical protein
MLFRTFNLRREGMVKKGTAKEALSTSARAMGAAFLAGIISATIGL